MNSIGNSFLYFRGIEGGQEEFIYIFLGYGRVPLEIHSYISGV